MRSFGHAANHLQARAWEILPLIREGLTNEQIAGRLGISRDGVKYHVSEILSRLGLCSRIEVARWYDRITRRQRLTSAGDWLRHPDLSSMRRIVDVGGGDGEVLKAILTAIDGAEGVLIDQPSVVESTRLRLESASVADRMSFASGSFFNQMPDGGDGYVLSDVMIDFGDEEDVRILRQCRSAMAADGRILVVERVVPEGPSPFSTNESSDEALSVFTRRTEREFQELYRRAGFVLTRVIPTATPQSILEGVPA